MFAVYSSRLQTFFNAMNRQIFTDIARKFDRVRAIKNLANGRTSLRSL